MEWKIKSFEELTADEIYDILKLRCEVFIVEQHCFYQDVDMRDRHAYHVMALDNGSIASYLRILQKGVSYPEASIGRVLTARKYRHRGIGRELMQRAMDYITGEMGEREIRISAQVYLRGFYECLGFEPVSEIYSDAGVDHIEMFYSK